MKLSSGDVSTQRRNLIDSSLVVSRSAASDSIFCPQTRSKMLRVARGFLALCLSFVLVFTPFSPLMMSKTLAPISAAKADAKEDLKNCLDIMSKTVDAAKAVAAAVADPQYLACAGQVAALNPVTIAMVGAVTAFWATDTSSFDDPQSCKEKVTETMLGFIADQLSSVLSDPSGLVYKIVSGIIGKSGVAMINDLAGYFGFDFDKAIADEKDPVALAALLAKKEVFDSLLSALSQALTPVMFQLNCGCYIAGTAAIIKHQAEEVGKSGDACLSLLLNPGAILNAFLDDPLGTLGVVGKAVCGAAAEVADICGAAAAVAEFFGDLADAACSVPGVCSTASAVIETISCWFSDCEEPKAPPPPPQCSGEWGALDSIGGYCICNKPMGKYVQDKTFKYDDYGDMIGGVPKTKTQVIAGAVCRECPKGMGVNAKGFCEKCDIGFTSKNDDGTPAGDGSCSRNYFCADNEHYKADNTGCFSCPAGFQFNPTNTGCWPVCEPPLINSVGGFGNCVCPDSADGKPQQLVGVAKNTCAVVTECSDTLGLYTDLRTNACVKHCEDNQQYWGIVETASGEIKPYACQYCPDGKVAVDNVCTYLSGTTAVAKCDDDQIHVADGQCVDCDYGTQKGPGNSCVPVCGAGSQANPALEGAWKNRKMNPAELAGAVLAFGSVADLTKHLGGGKGLKLNTAPAAPASPSAPPSLADQICTSCGENEESWTTTVAGPNYSKTETVCVKCKDGEVSQPGGRCHKPTVFQTTSLTPQMPPPNSGNVVRPTVPGNLKAKTYTPEEMGKPSTGGLQQKPKDKGKNTGTAALPKADPSDGLKGTTALPKQKPLERAKTTCPPGQVQQSGVCVFPRTAAPTPTPQAPQLNMPSMGGGSSAPGFSATPTAPSGTTAQPKGSGGVQGTTALPRQQGGSPQGTAVQPRQQGGGFQGTPVLPQQNNSGNSKPF